MGVFEGLKLLELGAGAAGPVATRYFADQGATVVRVESARRPDFLRMCCRAGFGWTSRFPASSRGADLWDEGSSVPRDLFARGIAEGLYVDEEPELLVRKMLALKQVELAHWVDSGMETPHEVVLDRLEDQFVRAFCTRES